MTCRRYMQKMVEAGLTHAVLETTSHGWAQHRVDACEFDIGVVTNITHEHLDEHGSYENYRAAKARLISSLATTSEKPSGNPRLAVLNRDDSSYEFLAEVSKVRTVSYGTESGADVVARDVRQTDTGTEFTRLWRGLARRHHDIACVDFTTSPIAWPQLPRRYWAPAFPPIQRPAG